MDKIQLKRFIDRYSLGLKVETALWTIDDDGIKTSVVNSNKTFVGHVSMANVKFAEPCEIGVNTPQFVKLLSVLEGNINTRLLKVADKPIAMTLDDGNIFIKSVLRDKSTIPIVPPLKMEPDYDVVFKLTQDIVSTFIKSVQALPDEPNFTIRSSDKTVDVLIGHSGTTNTNTVKFSVDAEVSKTVKNMTFVSEYFVDALKYNADIMVKPNSTAIASFSKEGMAKLVFSDMNTTATYYFIGI